MSALAKLLAATNPFAVAALSVSALALCVSISAFIVALKNYRRKAGTLVRGSFSMGSSIHSEGSYLTSLTLENLKDRAVSIFAIYLNVGSNYFIKIEEFEEKPLILKAFETYQSSYGPIEFYGVSTKRINLDPVFQHPKAKKRLILSTGDGKYVVPQTFRRWNPVFQFFGNYMTAIVQPVRSIYKGVPIGGNAKFCIEFTYKGNKEEIVPIHPKDFEVNRFKKFQLTEAALENKATFEAFLKEQMGAGKLACKDFRVFDLKEWRQDAADFYSGGTIDAEYYGPFQYYVLGRLGTLYSDWTARRKNRQRVKSR